MEILTPHIPFSDEACRKVHNIIYKILRHPDLPDKFDYYAVGYQIEAFMIAHDCFLYFGWTAGITVFFMCYITCLTEYGSTYVWRRVLTLILPVGASLAAAICIHKSGQVFYLSQIREEFDKIDSLYWFTFVLAFYLVLSLTSFYDLLLSEHVRRWRHNGFDTLASIRIGAAEVGNVLILVGFLTVFVMGLVYLSNIPMLVEVAWISAISILIDVLFVRPLLVPAFISSFGDGYFRSEKPIRYHYEDLEKWEKHNRLCLKGVYEEEDVFDIFDDGYVTDDEAEEDDPLTATAKVLYDR